MESVTEMAKNQRVDQFNERVDDLLQREKWAEARGLLERERKVDPENHWLITQIGVTYYEQRKYEAALEYFLMSREIVTDCPLTLWNLAGALDSLGKSADALSIYSWLLQTNKSPDDDPCWESKSWTDSLKADCVYRIGVCLGHLGKSQKAEDCYRQYLNLLSIGIDGSYSIDDLKREFRELHRTSKSDGTAREFRKAVQATLQISQIQTQSVRRGTSPIISIGKRHRERRNIGKQ